MKFLTQLARLIVGILFIISGFVKVVDPIGLSFKLEEYFSPSVLNIPYLMDSSLYLAVFFSIFEIVLGVLLLLGIFRKFTVFVLFVTIIFFTFLTFYSAYYNKVTDCGCFGDALKLEPWTSFYKDLILLILIIILIIGNKYIKPLFVRGFNIIVVLIFTLGSIAISYIGINHLPIIDFRPYAVGKDLIHGMKSAEELGLPPTTYKTMFTLKNKLDGSTIVVDDKKYINQKLYQDISVWQLEEDKTLEYLNKDKFLLIVIPFAENFTDSQKNAINKLAKDAINSGYSVAGVSNNSIENLDFELCFMDQTTMKTIIRSNPGLVLIKNGIVKAKYHYNDLPTVKQLNEKL